MQKSLKNLTQFEIPRLPEVFNLTDGHIHRGWNKSETKIINRLPDLFQKINRETLPDLERDYIGSYFRLAGQTFDEGKLKYLLCTSASMGLEIVANYLRLNNKSLALIEPCFDNLADIFKRHGIKLEVFDEKYLYSLEIDEFLKGLTSSVICLVTPNNPTGVALTRENLIKISNFCKENNKLLIIDASFRFYTPKEDIFDAYQIIDQSGAEHIFIEDTGKTWPTHDIKVSILAVSKNIYQSIYDIYTDFILHISPFALKLLTEFIKNSIEDELAHVHEIVAENRKLLSEAIQGTFLRATEQYYSSVAWLDITNDLTAIELKEILDKSGVFVLPGNYFFWSDHKKGDKFIRVALTRDGGKYENAMKKFREVLEM